MNIPQRFYTLFHLLRKPLLACLLLCCVTALQAQYEDTAYVEEKKVVIDEADNQYGTDQQKDFFQPVTGYDSLFVLTRHVPDSVLRIFGNDKSYWYSREEAKKGNREQQTQREVKDGNQKREKEMPPLEYNSNRLSNQTWFRSLMWIIIIGGFAGALAWYLANNNVSIFRRKEKQLTDDAGNGEIPENIFVINYQLEIDKAAAQGNYRLAIRLMYLRVLKNLSEKNVIQYKQDRTNFDYLMQVQPTAYYRDFFRITRHYEYSWYGEFNVSPDAYHAIRKEFDQFEKTTG